MATGEAKPPPVVVSGPGHDGVQTIRFNDPRRLNAWGPKMIEALSQSLKAADANPQVKAVVLTGTGRYYSAGVDFASSMEVMLPSSLVETARVRNRDLFLNFIDFGKPLICAIQGPAVGAPATSATLCDVLVATEAATFCTPFARLGLPPEGCSSYNFARLFGQDFADRMLLQGDAVPAAEAAAAGMVHEVTPTPEAALAWAQAIAADWAAQGRPRRIAAQDEREVLRGVNEKESKKLGEALIGSSFLAAMTAFCQDKGKTGASWLFWVLLMTRPVWSRL